MQKHCFVIIMVMCGINAFNNYHRWNHLKQTGRDLVADIDCGQKNTKREGKVVGGTDADKAEFPWLVSITRRGGHFCGGTVISNTFVLTAAHCMCTGIGKEILSPAHIKVTMAQHDLTKKTSDAYQVTLKSITVHPEYKCGKASNDIAILEMDKTLEWSDSVSPACLSSKDTPSLRDVLATVAGWGWTNELTSKGGRANVLQKAKVNVIGLEQCQQWYKGQGKKTQIQQTQICAGHEQGGVDACWADSGGPLMIGTGKSDQMMVVGVVSTGIGCARPYLPGLYTRVSEYIPWIREIIDQ